jgi:NFU1 iron-sulfur cluster scaffold homolog, mitochondrial
MSQAIMIRATVDKNDINICSFTVDRPVHSGKAIFASKEEAQAHGLAKNLFENMPEVKKVEVADNIVTVTIASGGDWAVLGRRVGAAIRAFLQPELYTNTMPVEIIKQKVQEVLDRQINPSVASHGGFVDLINIENNNVYIRMGGGCQGCGAADMTLKMGIERMIREAIPSIGAVLDVTDHAGGSNPYYAPSK